VNKSRKKDISTLGQIIQRIANVQHLHHAEPKASPVAVPPKKRVLTDENHE